MNCSKDAVLHNLDQVPQNPFMMILLYIYSLYFVYLVNKLILWPQDHETGGKEFSSVLETQKDLK